MNTKLNNEQYIKQAFDELFNSFTEEEKLESEARLLMFRFLDVIERKREKVGWSRKQLAQKVGTSASYITQLMRGDKLINMLTLAKMQKALDIKFDISEIVSYQEQTESIITPIPDEMRMWFYKKFGKPDYNSKVNISEVKISIKEEAA